MLPTEPRVQVTALYAFGVAWADSLSSGIGWLAGTSGNSSFDCVYPVRL